MWRVIIICAVLDNMVHASKAKTKGSHLTVVTSIPYKPTSRVVGGQPAPIEKYPYAVQVTVYGLVTCGGTLLTQKHVLSAAHCGYQYGNLLTVDRINVRVGSAIPLSGTTYYVVKFNEHPSYSRPIPRDNDIAIFITERMVALRDQVAVATIAPMGYESAEGATVYYIGWGYLGNELPQANSLQEVPVQVVDWAICRDRYMDLSRTMGKDYSVTENMFCAGILDVGGQDACGGDSGGPVIEGGVVVGIISWGLLCAEKHYPGVNTKVSRYYDWIYATVENTPGMLSASNEINKPTVMFTILFCVSIAVLINNKDF